MLNFIIGVKGSGKTAKAHEILGQSVKNGEKAMLIVPKQFTFQSDKRILELLGPRLACEVDVLSFSRLASVVLQTYGGITSPIAKEGARSILMSLAVESLTEKLSVFSRHKNEIALVSKMLDTLDEMKKEGITLDEFEKSIQQIDDNLLKAKARETALILRAYDVIVSQNYFDDADLLSFVAESLKDKDFFKDKTVVFDGFAYFTKPEIDIILTALRTAKDVYITLCSDSIDIHDNLSPFALCNASARKLRLCAGNNGISVGKVIRCERSESDFSPALYRFEKEIYKAVPEKSTDKVDDITVTCSASILHECDFVARKIKRMLRSEKYRCRDITVCFRNGEVYEKHLRHALKKYGVPLFEDKRQAVENQPLVSFVSSLLLICAKGLSTDYIFRLCKTGLMKLTNEEISEAENYCFMWDITGKKWLSPFTENPDGLGEKLTEERQSILDGINRTREKIILPITDFKEKIVGLSGKEAVSLIYSFLRENKIDESLKEYAISLEQSGLTELALEQEQVWDILMEAFDEIACTLGDNVVSPERLSEIFTLVIRTKSLGKLPDGFDEVLICSADRMLTNNSPVVFVMGLNNGVFPASAGERGIFSRKEKDKFKSIGLEIGEELEQTVARERFLLYNALASATDELHLTYSVAGADGEKLNKSEGVEQALAIFPSLKIAFESDESEIELVESEEAAFELLSKKWNDNSAFVSSLKSYFADKEEYRSRLEAIKRAVNNDDFAFENKENAIELFGKNMSFSASKLEDYGKCPFLFFCRYGLKAKPRMKARLDAAQSGTVIHYVLEILLGKYKGEEFLKLTDEKLHMEIGTILKEYMEENMGSDESKTERFNYLYYRTGKVLEFIMMRLKAEFEESDFVPCDFELRIGRNADVEPMVYNLERGSASLYGFIDRVDSLDLDGKRYIRIVDYKSGEKKFKLGDVLAGMNMQMLLYLVSIWRNGKGYYENITPSGVLYFPARITPLASERNTENEQRLTNRLKTAQMSGMLVDDGDVIAHMEKNLRGMFIPAKFDEKKQVLKGDFITLKQLEALAVKMDEIICDMGNSIHNGIVPAMPVCGSAYTDVCSWCDYGDICMKENPRYRYIKKQSHDEAVRTLMGGDGNEQKLD